MIAELFADEPARTVVVLVAALARSNLRRHLLESIDDCQVLTLYILIQVVKTAQFFWSQRSLRSQLFDGLAGPIEFASHIVHSNELLEKVRDRNAGVGFIEELVEVTTLYV